MSLINKMLQDLDARGSGKQAGGPPVHMMQAGAAPRTALMAGAGVAVIALAAAGWFGWKTWHRSQAKAVSVAAGPSDVAPAAGNGAEVGKPMAAASVASTASVEPTAAMAQAANPAQETSRAGRAARIAARQAQERAAEEKSAAQIAAELKEAKQQARQARVEAAALAATHDGGRESRPARPVATKAAKAAVASIGSPAIAAAPATAPNGVSTTSQQQGDNAYKRALASLQDGRVPDAISNLEQAVYAYPRHDAARQTLVGLLLEARRTDEAMRHLQLGLGLDPKQQQMAMLLARLQIERGGPAVETLQRTLPYAGGNPDYLAFLGGALQKAQRHREAVEQYQAALRLMPQNGVWWMGMGISLQADKRTAEAQEAYQRAKASGSLSPELASFVERKLQQMMR